MPAIIESLTKQVSPPQIDFQPTANDWRGVEEKLGTRLPEDYKRIVELYGDFYWVEFFHVLNPFSENKNLNLFARGEIILAAERDTRAIFPEDYPIALYPEPNGMLPFLITDNGDTGFWITRGAPERWVILIKGARAGFRGSFYPHRDVSLPIHRRQIPLADSAGNNVKIMAYSLYIERKSPITVHEWLTIAETIDDLKIVEVSGDRVATNPKTGAEIRLPGKARKIVVLQSVDSKQWIQHFHFWDGRILIKPNEWDDPRSNVRNKAFEIARKLNAQIVGDEGEIYTN